jgi:hypothetical protein
MLHGGAIDDQVKAVLREWERQQVTLNEAKTGMQV